MVHVAVLSLSLKSRQETFLSAPVAWLGDVAPDHVGGILH